MRLADVVRTMKANDAKRYPQKGDQRLRSDAMFPRFTPKFPLDFRGLKLFPIGSCFARRIESAVPRLGADALTLNYRAPDWDREPYPRLVLNEFNPGTMSQRILFALDGKEFPRSTIMTHQNSGIDLLAWAEPVSASQAIERRARIGEVYQRLRESHVVVITLGLAEAWFDEETKFYLNRAPLEAIGTADEGRFSFRRLDVDECMDLLNPAIDRLVDLGIKIVLTVSPIPMFTTFSSDDCVVANERSKAILRVCADRLAQRPQVDYFPAYEIVRSAGMSGTQPDNVHPREDLVKDIIIHMAVSYGATSEAMAASYQGTSRVSSPRLARPASWGTSA